MNYLLSGHESKERVELLLKLTKISSEAVQEAITDHLVKGLPENLAASLNDVQQPNFYRALTRLNEVACIVEEIKAIDWAKRKIDKSVK